MAPPTGQWLFQTGAERCRCFNPVRSNKATPTGNESLPLMVTPTDGNAHCQRLLPFSRTRVYLFRTELISDQFMCDCMFGKITSDLNKQDECLCFYVCGGWGLHTSGGP